MPFRATSTIISRIWKSTTTKTTARNSKTPAWHIHNGAPPQPEGHVTFGLLLNLVSVCNSEDPAVIWGFITRYAPDAKPETAPVLDQLVAYAVAYYRDFVKPNKSYRAPTDMERAALEDLVAALGGLPADADAETIQTEGIRGRQTSRFRKPARLVQSAL